MRYSLGLGVGGGAGLSEPFPSTPQVLHPSGLNWLLKCDVASSLLICHMLLPLVTIVILLSFFYEEVGILQLNPRRRESWMGRAPHWIGWPVAGWSRGVARAEALVSLKRCSPLFNPKQDKMEKLWFRGVWDSWNVCHLS